MVDPISIGLLILAALTFLASVLSKHREIRGWWHNFYERTTKWLDGKSTTPRTLGFMTMVWIVAGAIVYGYGGPGATFFVVFGMFAFWMFFNLIFSRSETIELLTAKGTEELVNKLVEQKMKEEREKPQAP